MKLAPSRSAWACWRWG